MQDHLPAVSETCGKTRYPDKRAAQTMANRARKRGSQGGRRKRKTQTLRPYHCKACQGWHLSSRNSH